jgi:hypothetical protein
LKFWHDQPDEAKAHWANANPTTHLSDALVGLNGMVGETDVWANGVCFDIGNIESLCRQQSTPIPWRYNSVRDARTIYRELPQLRERPTNLNLGPSHDPLTDCITQIWGLWEHLPLPL